MYGWIIASLICLLMLVIVYPIILVWGLGLCVLIGIAAVAQIFEMDIYSKRK
jgi:hypothetical protein